MGQSVVPGAGAAGAAAGGAPPLATQLNFGASNTFADAHLEAEDASFKLQVSVSAGAEKAQPAVEKPAPKKPRQYKKTQKKQQ